jgi:hypothetical protein
MTKPSSLAIDRGTLHLQVDIDLRGLVAGALFLAVFVAEIAIMRIAGPSYDAVNAIPFTT